MAVGACGKGDGNGDMAGDGFNPLTPAEHRVLVDKGTERAFSGVFTEHRNAGTYLCRRCNAALYRSQDKFPSHCGWPSFDDEISGAVRRETDADGRRVEILCAACGGHLGHVFEGEGFTEKNIRHCVNSVSLDFIPVAVTGRLARAIFAAGCFWGVEYHFQRAPGVVWTRVGYTGGKTANPTYKEVCTGTTGHAEAVEVFFDPAQTSYETLGRLFFETHDPTQADGQGPDLGSQYRSAAFVLDAAQRQTMEQLAGLLRRKGLRVTTRIEPADVFWQAEDYHQRYYEKKGRDTLPYCHRYQKRF